MDFERKWSIAHTAEREKRCLAKEKENGAVYLESMLRNTDWKSLMNVSGEALESGIFKALREKKEGRDFLDGLERHVWESPSQEAEYSKQKELRGTCCLGIQ